MMEFRIQSLEHIKRLSAMKRCLIRLIDPSNGVSRQLMRHKLGIRRAVFLDTEEPVDQMWELIDQLG